MWKKVKNFFAKICPDAKTFLVGLNAVMALSVAIMAALISYNQYKVMKIADEPFMAVYLESKYNEELDAWATEEYIVMNNGAHTRNIEVTAETFYVVQYFDDTLTEKPFRIPALFYPLRIHSGNSQGKIMRLSGELNRSEFVNAERKIRQKNPVIHITIETYFTITYDTIHP